eukprot:10926948-Karenia_brevis.AAC.1
MLSVAQKSAEMATLHTTARFGMTFFKMLGGSNAYNVPEPGTTPGTWWSFFTMVPSALYKIDHTDFLRLFLSWGAVVGHRAICM